MNVTCPNCQTTYRVDPERVPEQGVRTRCSACANTFQIEGTAGEAAQPAPATAPPETGVPSAAPPTGIGGPPPAPGAPDAGAGPGAVTPGLVPGEEPRATPSEPPAGPEEAPTPRPASESPEAPEAPDASGAPAAAQPGAAEPPTEARRTPVFGRQDPDTRAQRIARALVSDMVVYNGDRRDESLEKGTLRTDFKEEILKSWDEYVAQVGDEMAKRSPHFRDALNQILARGQAVF